MQAEILDSHCHVWQRWPYAPLVPDESTRGSVDQLLYEMDANGVAEALVICAPIEFNAENNTYAAFAAARHPGRLRLAADLDSIWSATYHAPGAPARLRALCERWPLTAVSHYLGADNDGWLQSAEADALLEEAERQGLLVSFSAEPVWQADLRALARRHPGVPILCHHLGWVPGGDAGQGALEAVLASASVANIHLKASGFHYCEPEGWNFPWPRAQAVLERLVAEFGAERLCWGSDFPASTRFCTYRQSLEVLRSSCAFLSDAERALVLGGTLRRLLGERASASRRDGPEQAPRAGAPSRASEPALAKGAQGP